MTRLFTVLSAAALLVVPAFAQTPSPRPSFDIAGIQVSTRPNPGMRGGVLRGNRYEIRNATMVDLIRTAYGVPAEKITGGPSWLEWNRFDIAALAPEGTTPEQLREMLKTLLADRFKVVVREEMTATAGIALKVAGAHKLQTASAPGACQGRGDPDENGIPVITMTCKGVTMAQLAEQLRNAGGPYFPGGQPVVDETGLTGLWDAELKFMPRQVLAKAGTDGITIQMAVEKLGLKLEPKEMTTPAIVVQNATLEFTPNHPDVAKRILPLPPPAFEVASLKLSPPEATQPRAQLQPSGVVNISGAPMNLVMALAWDLPNEQHLVGPGWLTDKRIDVVARAFATTNPNNQAQLDEDFARLMLRRLITERFQMKWRMEDRPMTAYNIVADGPPKMTPADPSRRTRCFEGLPPGSAAAAKPPAFGRQVTCQNISMDQFGQWLPSIAGGYTRARAIDMTGLKGGFDFTLEFSPIQLVQGPRPDGANPSAGQAVDPTGALSLTDAVRRQLGIRLEETKRLLPVLVIDAITETPLPD